MSVKPTTYTITEPSRCLPLSSSPSHPLLSACASCLLSLSPVVGTGFSTLSTQQSQSSAGKKTIHTLLIMNAMVTVNSAATASRK